MHQYRTMKILKMMKSLLKKTKARRHFVEQIYLKKLKKLKKHLPTQKKNNKLAELYNKNGYFPFVVILDKSGKKLGEMGYLKISPNEYINKINSISE